MHTKPNKPEVFAGWQDVFPPLSLNFKNSIWRIVDNSTTFIESLSFLLCQWQTIFRSITPGSKSVAAVVCQQAYFSTYHLLRLSPVSLRRTQETTIKFLHH